MGHADRREAAYGRGKPSRRLVVAGALSRQNEARPQKQLGEIWQVNPEQVSEALGGTLDEEAMEMLEGLEDFDFGDILQ